MVVVTDKDKKVLTVDNPDALKDHMGHHVAVNGDVMRRFYSRGKCQDALTIFRT